MRALSGPRRDPRPTLARPKARPGRGRPARSPLAGLVQGVCRGEEACFDELVERHLAAARKKAFAIIRDHQSAEDIAQEAFVKAFRRIGELKEHGKFGPWLLRIVQHTALDHRRLRKDLLSLEAIREEGLEMSGESGAEIEMELVALEEDGRILEVLRKLRADYREIFELKHLRHLSYKQIARTLGMSVSAVGEKLSRVRSLIKRHLQKAWFKKERRRRRHGPARPRAI